MEQATLQGTGGVGVGGVISRLILTAQPKRAALDPSILSAGHKTVTEATTRYCPSMGRGKRNVRRNIQEVSCLVWDVLVALLCWFQAEKKFTPIPHKSSKKLCGLEEER